MHWDIPVEKSNKQMCAVVEKQFQMLVRHFQLHPYNVDVSGMVESTQYLQVNESHQLLIQNLLPSGSSCGQGS